MRVTYMMYPRYKRVVDISLGLGYKNGTVEIMLIQNHGSPGYF